MGSNREDFAGLAMEQSSHFGVRFYIFFYRICHCRLGGREATLNDDCQIFGFYTMPRRYVGHGQTPYQHFFRSVIKDRR